MVPGVKGESSISTAQDGDFEATGGTEIVGKCGWSMYISYMLESLGIW